MNDSLDTADRERYDCVAAAVRERLKLNRPLRRKLPGGGRLRIDRQLPFLCVYRSPAESTLESDPGTRELVTSEAAYLFASGNPTHHTAVVRLCQTVADVMQEHFGAFLIIEIWAHETPNESQPPMPPLQPVFEVMSADFNSSTATLQAFTTALEQVSLAGHSAIVHSHCDSPEHPPHLPALMPKTTAGTPAGCFSLGLGVRPIYRDAQTGTLFPVILQRFRQQLAWALRRAVAEFNGSSTATAELHYTSLGPTSLVRAVRTVDQQLCELARTFDFLLQVTPTNDEEAWMDFRASKFRTEPLLHYRPLPYHPSLIKRRLFAIEIERIEDPTLAHLFWEKQEELDRQITALRDLDTPHFRPASIQLYGTAEESLVNLAVEILHRFPAARPATRGGSKIAAAPSLRAGTVVRRAREEIEYYRKLKPGFDAEIQIRDDIASGIMVSRGRLLIAESIRIPGARLEPLLHHEIGTHLLTYFNGLAQPFHQLSAGLAGYEELQEGLAVLAEYLTGGLTAGRLRSLAGRVLAAKWMIEDATFTETFHRLVHDFDFSKRRAFVTTLRAFRGGGLTKDVIYLRGLRDLLDYLSRGHDVEPLYAGKIGLCHVPYIQEMRRRGIVNAPAFLPRFWCDPAIRDRLDACRQFSVLDLVEAEQ